MVYVCVDAAMVAYETVYNIVQGKNQCATPRALQPHKELKKRAGQATPPFTFPFKATTFDCPLYIGNLRRNIRCNHGGEGKDFCFFQQPLNGRRVQF